MYESPFGIKGLRICRESGELVPLTPKAVEPLRQDSRFQELLQRMKL